MKKDRGPLLVTLAASLWAMDGVLRRSLYTLPPLTIVLFEHLIGLAILVPTNWKKLHPKLIDRRSWLLGAAIGLFSGLIGTLAFTAALQQINFIPFSVVLLMQKLQPIFAGLTAYMLLKERFSSRYMIWALAALIAGFFVTFPNGQINWVEGQGQIYGAVLALVAAIAWGGSTSLSKLLLQRQGEAQATTLRFFWTIIWSILGMIIFVPSLLTLMPTLGQIGLLVAIAFSTGMVAVFLYYRGLKTTPVMVATILELIFPVLAVFIDIFLYKSVLAPTQYLAAAAMLVCMYQVNRSHIAQPLKPL